MCDILATLHSVDHWWTTPPNVFGQSHVWLDDSSCPIYGWPFIGPQCMFIRNSCPLLLFYPVIYLSHPLNPLIFPCHSFFYLEWAYSHIIRINDDKLNRCTISCHSRSHQNIRSHLVAWTILLESRWLKLSKSQQERSHSNPKKNRSVNHSAGSPLKRRHERTVKSNGRQRRW